jgi:hypothetical protein
MERIALLESSMVRTAFALVFGIFVAAGPVLAADTTPVADAAAASVAELTTAEAPPVLSRPVSRDSRSLILPSLYVSLSALQVYDVYSTMTALKLGAAEANPFMKGVAGNPAAFVALKAGVTGVSIYAAEKLWKDKKRGQAIALMAISNGLMAYVAHNNASVIRSMR